jgi:hypothetical protein
MVFGSVKLLQSLKAKAAFYLKCDKYMINRCKGGIKPYQYTSGLIQLSNDTNVKNC